MKINPRILLSVLLILPLVCPSQAQNKKALTVTDIMKFRQLESPSISNDGQWVVLTARPDRGDPEVQVHSADGKKKYFIPGGEKPVLSNDGKWVAAVHAVAAEIQVNTKPANGEKKPEGGLILLNTLTGEQSVFENVQSFRFSNDSKWLLYHSVRADAEEEGTGKNTVRKSAGSTLNLVSMEDTSRIAFPFVTKFEVDSLSRHLAYAVSDSNGDGNGVFMADLRNPLGDPSPIYSDSCAWADCFSWNNRSGQLAFLAGITDKKEKPREAKLFIWSPGEPKADLVLANGDLTGDFHIWHKNNLRWTLDGKRLFMGTKPGSEIIPPSDVDKDSVSKLFDVEAILDDRGLDVWHWNDPYINPNQKKMWDREKDRTYTGVFQRETGRFTQLADPQMPELRISETSATLLGYSNVPYAKQMTWEGRFLDYYLVDLETGERRLVIAEQEHDVRLSPDGEFLVYYRAGNWHLLETSGGQLRNLTQDLGIPFSDEDWDYPGDVPGYGIGGWIEGSSDAGRSSNAGRSSTAGGYTAAEGSQSVLIYDKYDIWQFPARCGKAVCLTEGKGRKEKYQFRLKQLDTEKEYLEPGEKRLLTAYHDLKKFTAIYSMKIGTPGVTRLAEKPAKYTLVAKAKNADRILLTRESYKEFPDIWVADGTFSGSGKKSGFNPEKLTNLNPRIAEFAWGEAELVEWSSMDGIPLQGILIRPGNYKPGEKYPVLVYYYRFFSDRLYEFNEVVINHRPCFPFYASNGYAIFLPDIRFDIGNPGYSATKCLVPGVQKLIDMGIADPDAVCLHGHSWSGYQTAFVITQTDIFACAIAGAPVANMTSAYSGIRWGTGLARQFQYEKDQSRIGGSLWEARDKYIENSPVFFADRIHTPLLIEFGDEDEAVPWYQGIELYLAMRRLGKDCVFLQYRGEPHHLKQYANKLDYTLRFKEYLDHYLKGEPAPDWIREGVPYRGK
jgi:hypothetical protein